MNNLDETAAAVFDEFESQRELPTWPDHAMRCTISDAPRDFASSQSSESHEASSISHEEVEEEIISRRIVLFGAAANSSPRLRTTEIRRQSHALLNLGVNMRRGNISHWRLHQGARRVMDIQAIEGARSIAMSRQWKCTTAGSYLSF